MEFIECAVCGSEVRIYLLKVVFHMHERLRFLQGDHYHIVLKKEHIVNQVFCSGRESVMRVCKGYLTDLAAFNDDNNLHYHWLVAQKWTLPTDITWCKTSEISFAPFDSRTL